MPSLIVLRALVGAGLGLGALDVVWINAALAPHDDVEPSAPSIAPVLVREVPAATEPPPRAREPVEARVHFATMSAALDPRARARLAELVPLARGGDVVLEGHTDQRGTEGLNRWLREQRAVAVRDHLVQLGVPRARVRIEVARGAGASRELWRDRRVEIRIAGGTP